MKRIILSFVFLVLSFNSYAVTLDGLDEKSIFRGMYPKLFNPLLEDGNYTGKELKNVGVKMNDKEYLALYHPPEQYKNKDGEIRYLVYVERRDIQLKNIKIINGKFVKIPNVIVYGFSETCHICLSNEDLFIFKKNKDEKYELVSKNNKNLGLSSFGISTLNTANLQSNIINIKQDAVGFFFIIGSGNAGFWEGHRGAVILNEKTPITTVAVDIAEENSEGAYGDSVLSTAYDSTAKILENEPPSFGFYPIEVKFKGDYEEDDKFIKYNKIKKYEMQKDRKEYKEVSSRDY
ncbi:hypothetical protein I2F17_09080 [Acinetobacter sp. B10A]|uniref:hypothetical protein n=1 Tax=Acinetobacter baretiae TaxID=2605383 RepID=UPI001B3C6429|nr:hypothetical protein [Acinetobacter baretiae]MBF7685968.1 hypothetical protein [Acinetobacter baretiae]